MTHSTEVFATELRRLCAARGSIAQVCQATGINRQQFNKYLSGKALPSARNVSKIIRFLGVGVEQLMTGRASETHPLRPEIVITDPAKPSDAADCDPAAQSNVRHLQNVLAGALAARPANVLPLGHYDCYFPLHADSEMVVRWLISLRMKNGMLTFTCRANVRTMEAGSSVASLSKYHGIVVPGAREAHLMAMSEVQFHQPTVIAVNTLPVVGRSYFSGIALTRRIDGPLAIVAALRYRGHTLRVRKALDGIGIISLSDPDLDPVIVSLMRATPAAGSNWMQSVNGKSLRTVSPSGGSVEDPAKLKRRAAG